MKKYLWIYAVGFLLTFYGQAALNRWTTYNVSIGTAFTASLAWPGWVVILAASAPWFALENGKEHSATDGGAKP